MLQQHREKNMSHKSKEDRNAYRKKWQQEHKAEVKAERKEYYQNHKEEMARNHKEYRQLHPEVTRKHLLKKFYSITPEEYKLLEDKQEGKCAICGEKETSKHRISGKTTKLAVDHNHTTGKIRDLLCRSCNIGIGSFKDSWELMESASIYLKRWQTLS